MSMTTEQQANIKAFQELETGDRDKVLATVANLIAYLASNKILSVEEIKAVLTKWCGNDEQLKAIALDCYAAQLTKQPWLN